MFYDSIEYTKNEHELLRKDFKVEPNSDLHNSKYMQTTVRVKLNYWQEYNAYAVPNNTILKSMSHEM